MSLHEKISPNAKTLSWLVSAPILSCALYLYFSGNDLMLWVDLVRSTIFGDDLSQRLQRKFGFIIVMFTFSIPALIPPLVYDFVTKQGLFNKVQ